MLDSLETGALRFYLSADTEAERNKRFKYIKTKLTPIIDYLWEKDREDTCPAGYHNCDGYCVSYPCIGGPMGPDRKTVSPKKRFSSGAKGG